MSIIRNTVCFSFQGLKGVSVRSTSMSVAATPACMEAVALRGRGRPCMVANLCCLNTTTSSMLQATSAAVVEEQQVIYSDPPNGIHYILDRSPVMALTVVSHFWYILQYVKTCVLTLLNAHAVALYHDMTLQVSLIRGMSRVKL